MGAAHCVRTGFRQPPVQDFPFLDEASCRLGNFFDGNVGIDPMLIVEVNVIRAQSSEGTFQSLSDGLRAAGQADGPIMGVVSAILEVKAEFGGDDDALPIWLQDLPQQGFVAQGTVCFSRIEKGYPQFHGLSEQSYGFVLGKERRVALRQSHTAVSKG